MGITIHGEKLDMLRFADDIAVTAEREEYLEVILSVMDRLMMEEGSSERSYNVQTEVIGESF